LGDTKLTDDQKYRIGRLKNMESLASMLALVNSYHDQLSAASRELVLAICWEESQFQNIPQDGGPAVGYGQLERDGRRIANQHFTGNWSDFGEGGFNAPAILASKETSIRAVSHSLAGLVQSLGSQEAALKGYAGVKSRPENAKLIPRWQACAAALKPLLGSGGAFDRPAVEEALRLAKWFDKSGPVYEHIHERLWPLLDTLVSMYKPAANP